MFQFVLKIRPSSSFSGEQSRCSRCQGQPTPGDHHEDAAHAAADGDKNYANNNSDDGHDDEDGVVDDDDYLMFL